VKTCPPPCGVNGARKVTCVCEPPVYLCMDCALKHRCPSLSGDVSARKSAVRKEGERASVMKPLKEALEELGFIVYRMQSGTGVKRMAGHPAGTPDLLVLPSLMVFVSWRVAVVEGKGTHPDGCKCPSCKAQRETREDLEGRGVKYVFARSVAEGLDGLGLTAMGAKGAA
jgi:hypothetical protein